MKLKSGVKSMRNKAQNKIIMLADICARSAVNYRMDLIRTFQEEGFCVHVLTQKDGHEKDLIAEGVIVHPLLISRAGLNPFLEIICFFSMLRCLISVRPIVVLGFTIKPVVYGALACRILNIRHILTMTGLGTAFISQNWITFVVKLLMRISFANADIVFFQNNADRDLLLKERVLESRQVKLVPGSGVNLSKFGQVPIFQKKTINYLFIGRLIKDKGLEEFVNAAHLVKKTHQKTKFLLLGPVGVENRSSVSIEQFKDWQKGGIIEYLGDSSDVRSHLKDADCIVLPSYREGLSKVLLEAGAVGRPAITSDVPGCKDVIEDGINGLLCEVKNANDLAAQMLRFANMPFATRVAMGNAARDVVQSKFDVKIVCGIYVNAVHKIVENYYQFDGN